jgi:Trypsin-like peptidase domain
MRIAIVILLVTALLGGVWAYRQERNDRRKDVARLEGELNSMRHDLAGARRTNAVLRGAASRRHSACAEGEASAHRAREEIQSDAAAYPGISGGPVVDVDGQVVGVLVSGEGENLNFAVPINLTCVRLRRCGHGR